MTRSKTGNKTGTHQNLKELAKHEFIRFFVLFLYLWAMFLLFELHQYVVLSTYHLPIESWSIGFFNALVLAKVMMIADGVRSKTFLRNRPLFIAILGRSIAFAILFVAVDVLEKALMGWLRGQPMAESVPAYGGGGLAGKMVVGVIIAVSLIPYFAFREIDIKLGEGRLSEILFGVRATPGEDIPSSPH
jgi:uncharacterized membrane protein YvlD (DUF360 family)